MGRWNAALALLLAGACVTECHAQAVGRPVSVDRVVASAESLRAWGRPFSPEDERLLEQVQRGCFNYFWNEVGDPARLARDKTTDTVCSIAAVGFQLSSLPIGVERGWVSRAGAQQRAVTVLRALVERDDNKKRGIYLHFLDADTGGPPDASRTRRRYERTASTIDHALLQAGVMTASEYFGGRVRRLADRLIDAADWAHYRRAPGDFILMGWNAETDAGVHGAGSWTRHGWTRSGDESRLVYFLAVGAEDRQRAVPPVDYYRLQRAVEQYEDLPPFVVPWSGSLFMYFFAHCWIDYGGFAADDPGSFGVDAPRVDWFENTRRAALTHRRRCIEAADEFPTFGENRWGLAPCFGLNGYCVQEFQPNLADQDRWCDGVVPSYAAASVMPMAPAESMAAVREYRSLTGAAGRPLVWRDPAEGGYGFVDSFRLDPPLAIEANLGIDQGPMLLAIENARTGLVWRLFMGHPVAQRAVERLRLEPREKTWLRDRQPGASSP